MIPADLPGTPRRLLVLDGAHPPVDHPFAALPALLCPGDLLVLNDAATLPASLPGRTARGPVEVRLAGPAEEGGWCAILFGAGEWRTPTEGRGPPPTVAPEEAIHVGDMVLTVLAVDPTHPRLVRLALDDRYIYEMYQHGSPVQYSYLAAPLALWDVQTLVAGRPWAVEPPSAALPLTGASLLALRRRGVGVAALTHAAGLSSTGDPTLDARLPLPERTLIPQETIDAVDRARARGGRVIAAGTSVARALEGRFLRSGRLTAGDGWTDLRLGPSTTLHVVDGILTGMHEPEASHYRLLQAFAPIGRLDGANTLAVALGYRWHEHGDGMLVLPPRLPPAAPEHMLPSWPPSSPSPSSALRSPLPDPASSASAAITRGSTPGSAAGPPLG